MSDMDDATRAAKKRAFLADYRRHGVVSPAADAAGVHRRTILRWRDEDEEFDAACDDAFQQAVDGAEAELRRRGVDGTDEPVLYRGEVVWRRDPATGEVVLDDDFNPVPLTIPRRSDRLLEVYTRAHRPVYKERSAVELTGANGAPLQPAQINVHFVDPPDWDNVEWDPDTGRPVLPRDPLED